MNITWKDGITTLSTAAAVVVERAYFHEWDWPLISSMRWVITGLVVLTAVGMLFSYVLDSVRSSGWSIITALFGVSTVVLAGLGMYYVNSDYVVLLMLNAVFFWLASIVRHISVHAPIQHHA